MEVDQIQCKFPRINNGNGRLISAELGQSQIMDGQFPDEEEGERKRIPAAEGGRGRGVDLGGGVGRFYRWPASRIVRVNRASGGKDRHSKVVTSKGLRDRRVRLSVNTAIQFYDLQDRLGYDQPSKAVEWLLKAAASSIATLPPVNALFPDTPKQLSDEKRSSTGGSDQLRLDTAEADMDDCGGDPSYLPQQQVTKSSACSSNSENSKGSGLSLSRSDNRIKARERAKERVAEKKEKEQNESSYVPSLNHITQTTSFTELLNGGFNSVSNGHCNNSIGPNDSSVHQTPSTVGGGNVNELTFLQKSPGQWSSTPMDYFTSGLLGPPETRPGEMQFVSSLKPNASPLFTVAGEHRSRLQTFDFATDHLVSVGGNGNGSDNRHNGRREYNLNFSISSASSSGLAGLNRGTLQSNASSPSLLPPVQRFTPTGGSPTNFLVGTTAPVENHHQFLPGFDARLELYYGDSHANSARHADRKGKGKN